MAINNSGLEQIQRRNLWLATRMIDCANKERQNIDGLKIGGHQASSASLVTVMTALWFGFLKAEDQVSVKPHASPVLHAINFLLVGLFKNYLTKLRAFGSLQSYPYLTKDPCRINFSTGSVGLGASVPIFNGPFQAWLDEMPYEQYQSIFELNPASARNRFLEVAVEPAYSIALDWLLCDSISRVAPEINLVSTGVVIPEVLAAVAQLESQCIVVNVIDVVSPSRIFQNWQDPTRSAINNINEVRSRPFIEDLVGNHAPLVSIHGASSHAMSWLGSSLGVSQISLGVDAFGQSGTIPDLYRVNNFDSDSMSNLEFSDYQKDLQ